MLALARPLQCEVVTPSEAAKWRSDLATMRVKMEDGTRIVSSRSRPAFESEVATADARIASLSRDDEIRGTQCA